MFKITTLTSINILLANIHKLGQSTFSRRFICQVYSQLLSNLYQLSQEYLEPLVRPEPLDHRDPLDQLVLQVLPVPLEFQVRQVVEVLEPLGLPEQLGILDHPVQLDQ